MFDGSKCGDGVFYVFDLAVPVLHEDVAVQVHPLLEQRELVKAWLSPDHLNLRPNGDGDQF
jgi:hypothetical protein